VPSARITNSSPYGCGIRFEQRPLVLEPHARAAEQDRVSVGRPDLVSIDAGE
jgi:hypothetical protein